MWKKDENGNLVVVNGNPVWVTDEGEKEVNYSETLSKLDSVTSESIGRRQEIKTLKEEIEQLKSVEKPDKSKLEEELQKQLAEKDGVINQLKTEVNDIKLTDAFKSSKFIQDNIAVPAEMLRATFGNAFSIEDGKIVAKDQNGNVIYSRENYGQPATFEEAISTLVDQSSFKDQILKSSGNQGSGSNNGGGKATGKWDDYTEAERVALSKQDPQLFKQLLETRGK